MGEEYLVSEIDDRVDQDSGEGVANPVPPGPHLLLEVDHEDRARRDDPPLGHTSSDLDEHPIDLFDRALGRTDLIPTPRSPTPEEDKRSEERRVGKEGGSRAYAEER